MFIQMELEPLGYRYLKSARDFRRNIDKSTNVYVSYDPDCFHRGFTDVTLLARAEYRDIEDVIYELNGDTAEIYGRFGLVCRLQWLLPEEEENDILYDASFRDDDTEETYNAKLEKLITRMHTNLLPYIEKLSHRESAIEAAIFLDRRFLIREEFVVPVMYCAWRHDKKAALDYLEEKRLRRYNLVTPQEWELLKRMKNGEEIENRDKPFNAISYEKYMEGAEKFKEWMEAQDCTYSF